MDESMDFAWARRICQSRHWQRSRLSQSKDGECDSSNSCSNHCEARTDLRRHVWIFRIIHANDGSLPFGAYGAYQNWCTLELDWERTRSFSEVERSTIVVLFIHRGLEAPNGSNHWCKWKCPRWLPHAEKWTALPPLEIHVADSWQVWESPRKSRARNACWSLLHDEMQFAVVSSRVYLVHRPR